MDSLILIAAPAVEPIPLIDLKIQAGLSPVEDQDHVKSQQLSKMLRRHLKTARSKVESMTRRVLISQTWQYNLDGFPCANPRYNDPWEHHAIKLPKQPFQSMVGIAYIDITGTPQQLAQDTTYGNSIVGEYAYQLDPGGETQPARIAPAWFVPWPLTRNVQAAVKITFVSGYGENGEAMPAELYQAILFLAHSYYEPSYYKDVDSLVYDLISPYRNLVS